MKKKIILFSSILVSLIIAILAVGFAIAGNNKRPDTHTGSAEWKEVPIIDELKTASGSFVDFDLKKTITGADYVFSGTVISRKEYKVEWTDDKGEQWGPYSRTVIEVKVNKEYHGKSPKSGDIIKVYYPYSLSIAFGGSFLIKDGGEYVFVTQILDEEFIERREKEAPDDKSEQEKHADVCISGPLYNLMPIEDNTVFMFHNYFRWNEEVMKLAKSGDTVTTDKMSSPDLVKLGWFVALDINDFDKAFLKLFENPKKLPDANDLKKLREQEVSKNQEITSNTNEDIIPTTGTVYEDIISTTYCADKNIIPTD